MEPLVFFGAGLVVYCGYLAIMDEIRVLKKSFAVRHFSTREKLSETARKAAAPLSIGKRNYAVNRKYTDSNAMLVQH